MPSHITVRVLALCLLIGALSSWAMRHFGVSVGLGTVAVGVPGFGLLAGWLGKDIFMAIRREVEKTRKTIVSFLVETHVLCWFAGISLAVTASVSSVTVVSLDAPGVVEVEIDGEALPLEGTLSRFRFMTHPLGRTITVKAPGYRARTQELHPWLGLKVDVARDLEPSPTLLIRIPPGKKALLGTAVLEFVADGKRIGFGNANHTVTRKDEWAVVAGPRRPIPTTLRRTWDLELRVREQNNPARYLLGWEKPRRVLEDHEFELGSSVTVNFRAGEVKTQGDLPPVKLTASFRITTSPFQDVLLDKPEE